MTVVTACVSYVGGPLYLASPNAFARQGLAIGPRRPALSSRFDPAELLRQIDRHRLTTLVMVPTFFVRLLKLPEDVRHRPTCLRSNWCCTRVRRARRYRARHDRVVGVVLVETYGGSETGIATLSARRTTGFRDRHRGARRSGSAIKIFDENGREQPPGVSGEIYARSPAI